MTFNLIKNYILFPLSLSLLSSCISLLDNSLPLSLSLSLITLSSFSPDNVYLLGLFVSSECGHYNYRYLYSLGWVSSLSLTIHVHYYNPVPKQPMIP